MTKPYKSKMMEELYGSDFSQEVSDRLEELDPELNRLIQEGPYDTFWARKGLPIREKSLATVAALIGLGKEEQTKIHMKGFLHAGGSREELKNLLLHLSVYCGWPAVMTAFSYLNEIAPKD